MSQNLPNPINGRRRFLSSLAITSLFASRSPASASAGPDTERSGRANRVWDSSWRRIAEDLRSTLLAGMPPQCLVEILKVDHYETMSADAALEQVFGTQSHDIIEGLSQFERRRQFHVACKEDLRHGRRSVVQGWLLTETERCAIRVIAHAQV